VPGQIHNVVIDCRVLSTVVRFWAEALAYQVQDVEERWVSLIDPQGTGPRLLFQVVSEEKVVKNRVHLDVEVPNREAAATHLMNLGGTHVRDIEEDGEAWTVMRDPEGNEFCIFERSGASSRTPSAPSPGTRLRGL
jgi:catechol 2,3-dioxygenase-like lactoylglutathione lyase family enzyme